MKTLKDFELDERDAAAILLSASLQDAAKEWIEKFKQIESDTTLFCFDCMEKCAVMDGGYEVRRPQCRTHAIYDFDYGTLSANTVSFLKHFFNLEQQ